MDGAERDGIIGVTRKSSFKACSQIVSLSVVTQSDEMKQESPPWIVASTTLRTLRVLISL